MEVPAGGFFLFLVLINFTLKELGFYALDKTELSNSVSPPIMTFFEILTDTVSILSLLLGVVLLQLLPMKPRAYVSPFWMICFGIIFQSSFSWIRIPYAPCLYLAIKVIWLLFLIPILEIFTIRYLVNLYLCSAPGLIFPQYHVILPVVNLLLIGKEFHTNPPRDTRVALQTAAMTSLFLASVRDERFLESNWVAFWMYTFFLISAENERGEGIENALGALVAKVKEKKMANFIEFAVGMVGALLFQNFFRLRSFSQVLAFLCFAGAWLANLILMHASYDFGVFNFLLGNVVIGCTVSQYGLRATTWLAYIISLLLYGLRLSLNSWTLVRRPNQDPQVVLW